MQHQGKQSPCCATYDAKLAKRKQNFHFTCKKMARTATMEGFFLHPDLLVWDNCLMTLIWDVDVHRDEWELVGKGLEFKFWAKY